MVPAVSPRARSVRTGFCGQVALGNSVSQGQQVCLQWDFSDPLKYKCAVDLQEVHVARAAFHPDVTVQSLLGGSSGSWLTLGEPLMWLHLGEGRVHTLTLSPSPGRPSVLGTPCPSTYLPGSPLAIPSWLTLGWTVGSAPFQVCLVFLPPPFIMPRGFSGTFCPYSGLDALIYSKLHISTCSSLSLVPSMSVLHYLNLENVLALKQTKRDPLLWALYIFFLTLWNYRELCNNYSNGSFFIWKKRSPQKAQWAEAGRPWL